MFYSGVYDKGRSQDGTWRPGIKVSDKELTEVGRMAEGDCGRENQILGRGVSKRMW
jgi:hypothetical protein